MNHNKPDVYLIPGSFYYRSRAENLSKPAKLLFPLILEEYRKALAMHRQDDSGSIYCELPVEEAMQALTCSRQTAINAFRELEQCQFIRRIRLGQGQNARIYVPCPTDFFDCSGLNP